jgi:outer membrane receptor protein involved in Fe transport
MNVYTAGIHVWNTVFHRRNNPIYFLGSLAMLLLFWVPVHAQVAGGTLSGSVTDPTGAVIPAATITLKNVATEVTREVTVDRAGFYTAPNLLAGNYEVTASAVGFETETRTGIQLTVGSQQILNFEMKVGQVTERVQVEGGFAPAVQLATSSLSAVVDSTTVRELPLNGRSWTDLATLQPGVNSVTTQFPFGPKVERGNRGFGDQIAVNGTRPQQNNYRLDGISINDATNGGPGSVLGGNLGVDAVQEFSVITSNQSAEYGRTAGGVVNAITRSGTNQFHGSVYEFLRNSALDARNFFDGPTIPPFKRNQFGADAGGPILKNRVFIFGDYEGIRQSKGLTFLDTVPSAAARSGSLCSAPDTAPACTPNTITVDPLAQKYLGFWPAANRGIKPGTNGDIGIFGSAGQEVTHENYFVTRADAKLSDKANLSGTFLNDRAPFTSPDSLGNKLFENQTKREIILIEETQIITPTLVNSVRFGNSRSEIINVAAPTAINPLAKDPSLAAVPGNFAAQIQTIPGLTQFGGGVTKHSGTKFWRSYQGYDDAAWARGNHSFKFGGGIEAMHSDQTVPFSTNGQFFFGSFRNFLLNKPTRFLGNILPPGTTADTVQQGQARQTLFALYAQDDWHARPNLTLNLGLRWEMATNPTRVQGSFTNLVNLTGPTQRLGAFFVSNPTLRNFEPRVGFAWDPFHDGKTAVRGSFGIFDILPLAYQFDPIIAGAGITYPTVHSGIATNLPPGSFYAGAYSLLNPSIGSTATYNDGGRRTYVMERTFNVQRELTSSLTATVGYVGSRGVHLLVRVDSANMVYPVSTPAGYLFPSPVGSGTKLNPNYNQIPAAFYDGDLYYNALQVGLLKRMSHGVQLQGSFTWGKAIDTGSGSQGGDQFSNGISSLPSYNLKSTQGLADYSIGRTLVINGIWQTPSPKWSGVAGWITNGWQLGGIFKASDGVPFTPTWGTGGDPTGTNSTDDWAYPNHLTGPGCKTAVNPGNPDHYIKTECFAVPTAPSLAFYNANCDPAQGIFPQCFNLRGNAARNSLIGPGLMNLDFSMFKNNYVKRISETFNVQFRAEIFNILNHANFAVPITPDNTDIFDAAGTPTGVAGLLTATTTTSRQIQFGLKINW